MKRKSDPSQAPPEHNTYQTGSTTPPEKHSALVVILLVLVVFLSGLVSILGLLNFKMFSAFYEEQIQDIPLTVGNAMLPEIVEGAPQITVPDTKLIGFTGEPVTPVYQQHFGLPEGLFITFVEEGTSAHRQGIQEGDILLRLGNTKITGQEHIREFLEGLSIGDTFEAEIYRREPNTRMVIRLTIEEASS